MNELLKISCLAESSAEAARVTACSTDEPKCTSTGRTAPTINRKMLISVLVLLMGFAAVGVFNGLLVKVVSQDSFETVTRTFQEGFESYMLQWISPGTVNTVPSNIPTEEQCDNFSMHFNEQRLNKALKNKLHGQHLAREVIMDVLPQHIGNQTTSPLILSLHGESGVGKTYASHTIAHHLYRQGSERRFIHEFDTIDYDDFSIQEHYFSILSWIKGNVSACPYSVFIIDDAFDNDDFMTLFGGLLKVPAVDYTKSIFLLTSDYMSDSIEKKTFDLKDAKVPHKEFVSRDFEDIINELRIEGLTYGFQNLTIVPFLPLEHSHIRWCIQDDLTRRNCTGRMELDEIDKVAQEIFHVLQLFQLYASFRCS